MAGSGKSSLINESFLSQHREAVVIDQSPVGISSRSNPATYTGIMDDIRKAFAAANHADASLFSFNSKGACPNCQGLGVTYTDLGFLEGVKLPCEVCGGKRFKDEVLAYTLDGKSIADVLGMTIHQALEFFTIKGVQQKLQAMSDVGLDYLTLGQPLSTLSGGECQRLKLASELHKHIPFENSYARCGSLIQQGYLALGVGHLEQVALLMRQVLDIAGDDSTDRGTALLLLATLSYEWNHLAEAEQYIQQAYTLNAETGNELLWLQSATLLARVLYARGEHTQAQDVLQHLAVDLAQPRWYREIELWLGPLCPRHGTTLAGRAANHRSG